MAALTSLPDALGRAAESRHPVVAAHNGVGRGSFLATLRQLEGNWGRAFEVARVSTLAPSVSPGQDAVDRPESSGPPLGDGSRQDSVRGGEPARQGTPTSTPQLAATEQTGMQSDERVDVDHVPAGRARAGRRSPQGLPAHASTTGTVAMNPSDDALVPRQASASSRGQAPLSGSASLVEVPSRLTTSGEAAVGAGVSQGLRLVQDPSVGQVLRWQFNPAAAPGETVDEMNAGVGSHGTQFLPTRPPGVAGTSVAVTSAQGGVAVAIWATLRAHEWTPAVRRAIEHEVARHGCRLARLHYNGNPFFNPTLAGLTQE